MEYYIGKIPQQNFNRVDKIYESLLDRNAKTKRSITSYLQYVDDRKNKPNFDTELKLSKLKSRKKTITLQLFKKEIVQ